jgi:hypothetical protein
MDISQKIGAPVSEDASWVAPEFLYDNSNPLTGIMNWDMMEVYSILFVPFK